MKPFLIVKEQESKAVLTILLRTVRLLQLFAIRALVLSACAGPPSTAAAASAALRLGTAGGGAGATGVVDVDVGMGLAGVDLADIGTAGLHDRER